MSKYEDVWSRYVTVRKKSVVSGVWNLLIILKVGEEVKEFERCLFEWLSREQSSTSWRFCYLSFGSRRSF